MGYFKTYHSEKQGYSAVGKEFLEEHCLHIRMCKTVE